MSDIDDNYECVTDCSEEDDDIEDDSVLLALEPAGNSDLQYAMDLDENYPFKVLTTEDIMLHMIDSIKEVNTIVQVSLIKKIESVCF